MEILLALVVAGSCIASFLVGAKVGQQVAKGEDIHLPAVGRKDRAESRVEAVDQRMEAILRNIEAYDGTPLGQEQVEGGDDGWV